MKMSKKQLLAIALILTTSISAFTILRPATSTEFIDVDDYVWIEGVLHDDTYTLYPYAEESIDIGFSKYGEMIGYEEPEVGDIGTGLGIQYPGYESAGNTYDQRDDTSVDPFCNEYLNPDWWMNGWFIDIKYKTPAGTNREIWAMALFSDGQQYGGDWIVMPSVSAVSPARPLWQEHAPYANPDSNKYEGVITPVPERGGRKTNGHCVTDPIEIIYNGPRKFIALTKTTISDVGGGGDLVAIYITFIFNKAEKNVILLKDIKRLYTKQPMNIQFGNRGEWDLGIEGSYDSYTHWYTDHPVQYWDMDSSGGISGAEVEESFEFFKDYFLNYKHPKKWWDDVPIETRPSWVHNEWTGVQQSFPSTWLETQPTCYGREWHMDGNIKEHSYAVAQVITEAGDYVGALAVWPHPEFWSASNTYYPPTRTVTPQGNNPSEIQSLMLAPISRMLEWHRWTVEEDPNQGLDDDLKDRDDIWIKADDIRSPDGSTEEPVIPFIIYEHDFELTSTLPEYRMVSVYMVTDYHDADDADADDPLNLEDWSNGVDRIDREIQYQLDEIFDPWDINDAMHKKTKRWVQFFDHDYLDNAWDGENYWIVQLDSEREIESGELIPSLPVYWTPNKNWDDYCAFSERVLVDTGTGYELIYPYGYHMYDPIYDEDTEQPYYSMTYATGMIWFYEWDSDIDAYVPWYLPEDSIVKVLWSSEHHATTAEQWYGDDVTKRFPLHHDIMEEYKDYTEVFHIHQEPERFAGDPPLQFDDSDLISATEVLEAGPKSIPLYAEYQLKIPFAESVTSLYYDTTVVSPSDYYVYYSGNYAYIVLWTSLTLDDGEYLYADYTYWDAATIEIPWEYTSKEVDVKYHIPWNPMYSQWIEEKFHRGPVPLDLAFVLDVTGSMEELSTLQAAVPTMLNNAEDASGGDIRYSLVIFNGTLESPDTDWVEVVQDWTTSKSGINTAIQALNVVLGAGGYAPEASDEALNTTVNALPERPNQIGSFSPWRDHAKKILVLMTDAAPGGFNDVYDYPTDLDNAKMHADTAATKGIRIFSIEESTTSENTTEPLLYYAAVTGGRYIKLPQSITLAFDHMLDGLLKFYLEYPADHVEKAWHHSEKALPGGDYVFCGPEDRMIILQDPLPDGQWLWVEYDVGRSPMVELFHSTDATDEFNTEFGPLTYNPDLTTLEVYTTYIWEEITDDPDGVPGPSEQVGTELTFAGLTEYEYVIRDDRLTRGNWIIHETPTCDELVLDQAVPEGIELKIVFKVPSGRWEWGIVGEPSAAVDSIGSVMTVAAFKNKRMEFGLGGLDLQDETFGPRLPWMIRDDISPDSRGRYHLRDDWCTSWPVSSSNIITVGGPFPNMVSKYFNEYAQAMIGTTIGDGFFAVTCWDHEFDEGGWYDAGAVTDRYGYAVISTYKDKNGTIGFMVYGWTGQDTYYAAKWFDEHKYELQHINLHVTDLILEIEYKDSDGDLIHPPVVDIVEKLGTISEKPQHDP
jgi:hypothetical protein